MASDWLNIKPMQDSYEMAKSKIECSGWDGDAAILVAGDASPIGIFYEAEWGWDDCAVAYCLDCKRPYLFADGGRWGCRNCGADHRKSQWHFDLKREWREAQNELQWRPRG